MWTIILVSLGILLFSFLLLGYISPYSNDNQNVFQIQKEKIVEIPVEKIVEVEKIIEVENLDKIKQLEDEIKQLKSNLTTPTLNNFTWRNIGLELFNTNDLDKFLEILDGLIGKNILIVTDSSYVLEKSFTDHKVYEGTLDTYEIIEGRYPHQPVVKFIINIPIVRYDTTIPMLGNNTISLNWIYDKYKFNSNFSSLELVDDFIKTGIPKSELLIVKD